MPKADRSIKGLVDWSQRQIFELHPAVVALEQDGARLFLVAVQGAAGDSGDGLPLDDWFAVENDGNLASNQGDVHGLPLVCRFRAIQARGEEAIDAANAVAVGFLPKIVLDLHFVSATQVNAAVAAFGIAKL